MITKNSRYANVPQATMKLPDGRQVIYLTRRWISGEPSVQTVNHVVAAGERPDQIAARYLSDPLMFWRICDENRVMDPVELTDEPGKLIRIPLT